MADHDLDRRAPDPGELGERLGRIGAAAARSTAPRDAAATERRGRRRHTVRRAGAGLALAGLVGVLALGRTVLPSWDDEQRPIAAQPSPSSMPGPEPAAGGLPGGTEPVRHVAHGGLVFDVPLDWRPGIGSLCPGQQRAEVIVDPYPVPPPALGETSYALIGCARARHPFAQLRSVPDATLAGAAERTVAGRRVLVLDGGVQPPEAPAGWTVRTAVVPAPGGGGVLLQVSDPDGPGTFERILASVRDGGDGGGDPGSRRISWGGVSFEVPGRWGLVEAGDDCPRRPGDQVVYVGRDPAAAGCALPERYIEVTAAPAAPSSTVRLNGLDLELDANGRGNRSVRTATVADPRVRVRLVTTGAEDTSGAFDALLLSLRAG